MVASNRSAAFDLTDTTCDYGTPRRPFVKLPDLESATDYELADLAKNAVMLDGDLQALVRSAKHVRALCVLLGTLEERLETAEDLALERGSALETAGRHLDIARGMATTYRSKLEATERSRMELEQQIRKQEQVVDVQSAAMRKMAGGR